MTARVLEDLYVPEPNTGCWLWLGALRGGQKRYGGIYGAKSGSTNGKKWTKSAHRFFYEILVGPIPEGMTLDHLCRQPTCVNPRHLEVVTAGENTLRGQSVSAINKRKVVCLKGHPLSGSNLYFYRNKRRICKACARLHNEAWRTS